MSKIIWVDMDEVISDTMTAFLEFNNYQINWTDLKKEQITSYNLNCVPCLKISFDESIKLFYDMFDFAKTNDIIKPVSWAFKSLSQLKSGWYILKVITARQDCIREYTENWLERFFPNFFSDIYFTNHWIKDYRPKSEVIKKIWAEYMFEDNYDYAYDISSNCDIKTFLLTKPWNSNRKIEDSRIYRLSSWDDFSLKMIK